MKSPGPSAPDFRTLFEAVPGLYLVLTPDLKIVSALIQEPKMLVPLKEPAEARRGR